VVSQLSPPMNTLPSCLDIRMLCSVVHAQASARHAAGENLSSPVRHVLSCASLRLRYGLQENTKYLSQWGRVRKLEALP
jgi:hypothetical protein